MRSIAVFLSCQTMTDPIYINVTEELGRLMAAKQIQLIYGGSRNGLMGILARTVLENRGQAIGVLTKHLQKTEVEQEGLTKLIWAENIAQRLTYMHELADAFIVLPGGLGTMEELFNVWNEIRLGLSNKCLGLLNIRDYYTPFLQFITHMNEHGFVSKTNQKIPIVAQKPEDLLEQICNSF